MCNRIQSSSTHKQKTNVAKNRNKNLLLLPKLELLGHAYFQTIQWIVKLPLTINMPLLYDIFTRLLRLVISIHLCVFLYYYNEIF